MPPSRQRASQLPGPAAQCPFEERPNRCDSKLCACAYRPSQIDRSLLLSSCKALPPFVSRTGRIGAPFMEFLGYAAASVVGLAFGLFFGRLLNAVVTRWESTATAAKWSIGVI